MADTNGPGCLRSDEKRRPAGTGRRRITGRPVRTAAAACSAVFCGCAATVFLWAFPAAGDADVSAPPGGTAHYTLFVGPGARNTVVRATASPAGAAVRLSCPAGADGPVCRLGPAGPVDIPASVHVPASFVPGAVIRITEVASGRDGVTVQDMVIQVVSAAGSAADPSPSARPPAPGPAHIATSTPDPTHGATHTPDPTHSATHTPDPTHSATHTPDPTHSATHTPDPTHSATHTPDPTHSATHTPDPTHSATPTSDPTHSARPTAKPTHTAGATPKPSHSRTAPPVHRKSRPARTSHPAVAGNGHTVGPPSGGSHNVGATAGAGGPLPLPSVHPPAADPGQAGAVRLPPADKPAPAPILPSGGGAQPSPFPLPKITQDPAGSGQAVILPNRAGVAASSGTSSNFGLVEAQIIGLAVALGGALAVLLRPVRHRASPPAGQRRQRRTGRTGGAAGRARFWPPQFGPLRWHRDR